MATKKEDVVVETSEVKSSNEHTEATGDGRHAPNTPDLEMEPKELGARDKWMDLYDAFLCALPSVLMAKTILCIFAWKADRLNHGPSIEQVGILTKSLTAINGQVKD